MYQSLFYVCQVSHVRRAQARRRLGGKEDPERERAREAREHRAGVPGRGVRLRAQHAADEERPLRALPVSRVLRCCFFLWERGITTRTTVETNTAATIIATTKPLLLYQWQQQQEREVKHPLYIASITTRTKDHHHHHHHYHHHNHTTTINHHRQHDHYHPNHNHDHHHHNGMITTNASTTSTNSTPPTIITTNSKKIKQPKQQFNNRSRKRWRACSPRVTKRGHASPVWCFIARLMFSFSRWTGSNTNPNNNDGQGKAGTDRSNVILLKETKEQSAKNYGHWTNSHPKQLEDAKFLGFSEGDLRSLALLDKSKCCALLHYMYLLSARNWFYSSSKPVRTRRKHKPRITHARGLWRSEG